MAIPMSAALMAERHEHCPGGQDAVGRLVQADEAMSASLDRTAQFTRTRVRNLRHAEGRIKARRLISGTGG
jgi:hypothetical protein